MIVVQGSLKMAVGEIDRLTDAALAMVEATHKEAGCIAYTFSRDLADADSFVIFEIWTDDAALAAHFQTPHMAAFNAAMAGVERLSGSVKSYTAEFQRTLMGE